MRAPDSCLQDSEGLAYPFGRCSVCAAGRMTSNYWQIYGFTYELSRRHTVHNIGKLSRPAIMIV